MQRNINRGRIIDMGTPGALGALGIGPANGNVGIVGTLQVLFLQDKNETFPNSQPSYLAQDGIGVMTPELPLDDLDASVRTAELAASNCRPDVIVGRARGGAVAMNMNSGNTPILLLAPDSYNRRSVDRVKHCSLVLFVTPGCTFNEASSETGVVAVSPSHLLDSPESTPNLRPELRDLRITQDGKRALAMFGIDDEVRLCLCVLIVANRCRSGTSPNEPSCLVYGGM